MNNVEFASFKFLTLNTEGGTILCGSVELVDPKKLGPPSLIWGNFKKWKKPLLKHVE